MTPKLLCNCLLSTAMVVLSSGCLVKEKVTVNGEVMADDYKIKRPLKDAIDNSQ